MAPHPFALDLEFEKVTPVAFLGSAHFPAGAGTLKYGAIPAFPVRGAAYCACADHVSMLRLPLRYIPGSVAMVLMLGVMATKLVLDVAEQEDWGVEVVLGGTAAIKRKTQVKPQLCEKNPKRLSGVRWPEENVGCKDAEANISCVLWPQKKMTGNKQKGILLTHLDPAVPPRSRLAASVFSSTWPCDSGTTPESV